MGSQTQHIKRSSATGGTSFLSSDIVGRQDLQILFQIFDGAIGENLDGVFFAVGQIEEVIGEFAIKLFEIQIYIFAVAIGTDKCGGLAA